MLGPNLELALPIVKWQRRILSQLCSGETAHSNNVIMKENQMAYGHIFYESVTHADSHVTATLILCVTPSDGGKSTHTTWHALCQGIILLGRTAVLLGAARHNSSTVEVGSSISRIQTPILSQNAQWGSRLASTSTCTSIFLGIQFRPNGPVA